MKAVGLITEYNPFHNGHLYHLREAVKMTQADVCIAVMSGNFVQRGEPAMIHKYARCRAAVDCGVNLVVELPSFYALSSAEFFADGAVQVCDALAVSSLVFGSECGELTPLQAAADILVREPDDYRQALKNALATGKTFPQARQEALIHCLKVSGHHASAGNALDLLPHEELLELLANPNNILGIEYLKALQKHHSPIAPFTLKRAGDGYHKETLSGSAAFSSASAIRKQFTISDNAMQDSLTQALPRPMLEALHAGHNQYMPVVLDDFTTFLQYKLAEIFMKNPAKDDCIRALCGYADITPELASRIIRLHAPSDTFSQLVLKVKSRQYTYSRVCRCLMHIVLNIDAGMPERYRALPYVRILGFDKKGQDYLSFIKKSCPVPLITKTAASKALLGDDIFSTNIYNLVVCRKFGTIIPDEFHQKIYINPRF